jgi:hypothetical protein
VIVVVAGRHDAAAKAFVERGAAAGAALLILTPSDLSRPGWRFRLDAQGTPAAATAVVGGEVVAVEAIDGVLTRLPQVSEHDLGQIVPADRAYVAAEMSAFLLAWLSALPCPVLNRPTPPCLAGPCWAPERWVQLAARLGIPIRPVRRRAAGAGTETESTNEASDGPPVTVTVVGERCLGTADRRLAGTAGRLATAAGTDLLAVHFAPGGAEACLVSADPWPDVSSPEIADAVRAYLTGPAR